MKKQKMTCLLSLVVAMAGSVGVISVLNAQNKLTRADAADSTKTVSIYFGTLTGSNSTIGTNTSSKTYYTVTDNGTGFDVSSLSGITAAYRSSSNDYALRLGSTSYAGSVTFNFNASYVVTAASITTMTYGSDTSCGGTFTMSNGVKDTFTVTNSTAPSVSATTDTTTGLISLTGLDNGNGTASNSFTIAATTRRKRFYVYKINLTIAVAGSEESSSSSSEESSSSSEETSGSTPSVSAALALGKSSLTMYADGGTDNTTSVTATDFASTVTYSVATTNSYVATGSVSYGYLVVNPVDAGTATLTVTATDGSSSKTATLAVTVKAAATISLSDSTLALAENGTAAITLTKSGFIATPTVTVSTSASSVATATISGSTITVKALAAGTATITAKALDGDYAKTATCAVTVTAASTEETTTTYKLITSTSDLVVGNSYVIASAGEAGSAYFLGNSVKSGHTNYQTAVAGTVASDLTIAPTTDTEIFTLGGSTGAWTFTTTNRSSNGYLYAKSTYSLLVAASTSNYYQWSISFSSGLAQIKNNGLSKYIEYYSSYSDFDVDSSAGAYLYMKTTTGGGTVTPTVDPSLTLNKTTLSLTAGGASGSVTATASDFANTVTISAKSSSTSIATVAVSGTTITVVPVAAGSATVTVTATDGTTTLTKTVTVTVAAAASTSTNDAWTIMIYMCGADLESTSTNRLATGDLTEIKNTASSLPDNVNIIVEAGGAKSWASTYSSVISTSYLNRFHLTTSGYVKDAQITKANMGLSSTFQNFLEWGLNSYPADRTMVVMWDHGGAMAGCCYDENYSSDSLSNSEVKSALSGAFSATNRSTKLEAIGYDACLMSVQDVAEFNSSYFNYMIASEESEAGYGWDYDGGWLSKIYANPTGVATSTVLTSVVDTFITDNGGTSSSSNDQTLAYLDLSQIAAYKTAWENMASYLNSSVLSSTNKSAFQTLVKGCKYYAGTDYTYFCTFDAYDFLTKLVASSTFNKGSVSTYASAAKSALTNVVSYSSCGAGAGNSHGLCMFFSVSSNCSRSTNYASTETNFTNWRTTNSTYGV